MAGPNSRAVSCGKPGFEGEGAGADAGAVRCSGRAKVQGGQLRGAGAGADSRAVSCEERGRGVPAEAAGAASTEHADQAETRAAPPSLKTYPIPILDIHHNMVEDAPARGQQGGLVARA